MFCNSMRVEVYSRGCSSNISSNDRGNYIWGNNHFVWKCCFTVVNVNNWLHIVLVGGFRNRWNYIMDVNIRMECNRLMAEVRSVYFDWRINDNRSRGNSFRGNSELWRYCFYMRFFHMFYSVLKTNVHHWRCISMQVSILMDNNSFAINNLIRATSVIWITNCRIIDVNVLRKNLFR